MERRVFLAILLSFAVVFGFQLLWGPATTPAPTEPQAQTEGGAVATPSAPPAPVQESSSAAPLVGESDEREIVVESEVVKAVFTNRGARLKSWTLKKYSDFDGKPVELVSTAIADSHPLPLSLKAADAGITGAANSSLYAVEGPDGSGVVKFSFQDASGLAVQKEFSLGSAPYTLSVATHVARNGQPLEASLVWGPGLGDKDQQSGRSTLKPGGIYSVGGKVTRLSGSDVAKEPQHQQDFEYAGIDDQYFLSLALKPGTAKISYEVVPFTPSADSSEKAHEYMSYSLDLPSPDQPVTFYIGPKEFGVLASIDRGLTRAIHFGVFSIIVVPMLNALNWTYAHIVPNYGWAVALLTVFINLVLFPLNHKSVVSMRKMQEVQPEAKAIQERFSKLKATDPARQKMNQELMALYREKGVNPASGCVPLLLTLPVFFAFYAMLQTAIELRGAPFVGWIHDLSLPDPYYVLPVLVGASQILQTWMTPQAGMDPTQQKMMLFMPVVLVFMFLRSPSGALVYWLVNNVWRIGQMQLTNYLIGPPPVKPSPRTAGPRRAKSVGSGKTEGAT